MNDKKRRAFNRDKQKKKLYLRKLFVLNIFHYSNDIICHRGNCFGDYKFKNERKKTQLPMGDLEILAKNKKRINWKFGKFDNSKLFRISV